MLTTFRSSAPPQARPRRARLWRLLWSVAVLLGVLYTHGASGEIVAEHVSPSTSATSASPSTATARVEPPGHHGGDTAEHSAQDCASGQPQQAAEPAPPALSPLDCTAQPGASHAPVKSRSAPVDSPTAGRDPAVLRI
ncbi:hypothetical protein [Streptomyces cavernicola]|uniref:Secreted protein n=1 Tax=Streptomyces cavernicola TaxID=3043613 RepID=A0ABT6SDB3_9ACTN|nr:hypothetical protein [Streptomyces sp. B-S-A6]MDI3406168.1 hypothetical protein [Streptomyces sp. B-S-A6]